MMTGGADDQSTEAGEDRRETADPMGRRRTRTGPARRLLTRHRGGPRPQQGRLRRRGRDRRRARSTRPPPHVVVLLLRGAGEHLRHTRRAGREPHDATGAGRALEGQQGPAHLDVHPPRGRHLAGRLQVRRGRRRLLVPAHHRREAGERLAIRRRRGHLGTGRLDRRARRSTGPSTTCSPGSAVTRGWPSSTRRTSRAGRSRRTRSAPAPSRSTTTTPASRSG